METVNLITSNQQPDNVIFKNIISGIMVEENVNGALIQLNPSLSGGEPSYMLAGGSALNCNIEAIFRNFINGLKFEILKVDLIYIISTAYISNDDQDKSKELVSYLKKIKYGSKVFIDIPKDDLIALGPKIISKEIDLRLKLVKCSPPKSKYPEFTLIPSWVYESIDINPRYQSFSDRFTKNSL